MDSTRGIQTYHEDYGICTKGHKIFKIATRLTTVVQALKEHGPVRRIHFCNWFLRPIHDREVDPQFVFFPMRPGFPYVER
jgi:hypothetical protein